MYYCKYIKTSFFLIDNMHCYELNLDNFKGDFLNFNFFAPSDFQIVVSQPNIVQS